MLQRPRQIKGSPEEASDADPRPQNQLITNPSANLSLISRPASGIYQDQVPADPTVDNHFIVMHSMTTWSAFMCIADMLGLACRPDDGFNIRALIASLPSPVAPTLQQQIIPHKPYVDMLPWSSMRDRVLNSLAAINEGQFISDMTDMKVWGSTPWDPMAWEVGPEFARKWWFLMDDGIMHTTNFWRGQRGEEALVLTSL